MTFIFKDFISNHNLVAILIVITNSIMVVIFLAKYKAKIAIVLFISFFIRVMVMFWDIYGNGMLSIPHSGGDTENYLINGMSIVSNPTLLLENIYGGLYTKILGALLIIGPESRIIPQYINILLSLSSILLVINILKKLLVSKKFFMLAIIIYALFPHSIIFSSILLRESLVTFLVTLSIYYLVRWYKDQNVVQIAMSILIILIAASFHSGVIGILIGIIFLYFFYSHSKNKLKYSVYSSIKFVVVLIAVISVLSIGIENIPILNKFTQYARDIEDIYLIASGGDDGGSSYLTGLPINSFVTLIIFAPIKILYFLTSPLPWDWRGVTDIFSFVFDSSFYIMTFYLILKNIKSTYNNQPLLISILIGLFSTILIFSIGVSNTGTGMRHRYKMFFVLIIIVIMMLNKKIRRDDNYE